MVSCIHCLSVCVCVCLYVCLFFTGAIQWNPDFLCHNSFRGSSGSQSVLTFVNTSLLYEHDRFKALHRLYSDFFFF